jgi:hypothetical protein
MSYIPVLSDLLNVRRKHQAVWDASHSGDGLPEDTDLGIQKMTECAEQFDSA